MADLTNKNVKNATKNNLRKGSKAWRKNIDITQIEDSIHETVTQKRLGYDLVI